MFLFSCFHCSGRASVTKLLLWSRDVSYQRRPWYIVCVLCFFTSPWMLENWNIMNPMCFLKSLQFFVLLWWFSISALANMQFLYFHEMILQCLLILTPCISCWILILLSQWRHSLFCTYLHLGLNLGLGTAAVLQAPTLSWITMQGGFYLDHPRERLGNQYLFLSIL